MKAPPPIPERLSLSEIKDRGQKSGFTKIQRKQTSATIALASWNGFASESDVDVYYVLTENKVTVFKRGQVDVLS